MRAFLPLISFALLFCWSAFAQEQKIEEVISAQIEAFKKNDVDTAFSFASPRIQQLFGTSENFGRMVQNGYPMVWKPSGLAFLRQKIEGNLVYQEMRFIDQFGIEHSLVYEMLQVSGNWKINGVFKLRSNDVGA